MRRERSPLETLGLSMFVHAGHDLRSRQFTSLTDLAVHGFRCIIPLNNCFHSILSRLSWRIVNITAMKATSHLKIEISVCWRVLAFRNIQHIPNARRLTRNNTMGRRRKMCDRDICPDNCNLWSFKIRQGSRDMFHFLWTIDHSLHRYFWWRVTNDVNRTGYSTDDGLTLISIRDGKILEERKERFTPVANMYLKKIQENLKAMTVAIGK